MWLEGLLGDTDLLRLIKRYFAWFVVNLKSAQRQHKYENRPEIQMPCMQYFSANTGLRCKTYVFLFLASVCKTWHCCTNDLMPTNGNPPVTMTKKCLIIHTYVLGEELHISHTLQKPWTRSPRHPSRARKLIPDTWYLAAVRFSKWSTLHENYENLDIAEDSLLLFCTILFFTICSVLLYLTNIELIFATIIFTVCHIFIRDSKMLKIFK